MKYKILILPLIIVMLASIVLGTIPVMNSSDILPTIAYRNDTLLGYCNATDVDGSNVSYYYKLYRNDVIYYQGVLFNRGSISSGADHTCGIRANDSRVLCWGDGNYGRLGDGNTASHNVGDPTMTTDSAAYSSVSSGYLHTCAIRANDSRVLCWGQGEFCRLGDGDTSNHQVGNPTETTDSAAYSSIDCGYLHTCAIRANDSRVFCWGQGQYGILGDGNTGNHNVCNPTETTDSAAYKIISAVYRHTCGIRTNDSRVLCWGTGEYGRLGDGNTASHNVGDPTMTTDSAAYSDVGTGLSHTCGIRANDSRVLCWGYGINGRLGDGNTASHNVGDPTMTTDSAAYSSVSMGWYHSCGIRLNDSRVICWGNGDTGRLGDGDTSNHQVGDPNMTTDSAAYSSISSGMDHTCGIRANDSRVLCWGEGDHGKLGDGNVAAHDVGDPTETTDSTAYVFGFNEGEEQYMITLDSSHLSVGDEWILSCRAYDGNDYSWYWLNSTPSIIINYIPNVTSARIYPVPLAASGNDIEGFCNATDSDGDDVRFFWEWYLNGSVYSSGNSSLFYPVGTEVNTVNLSWQDTTVRDNWSFSCRAWDGYNYSSWLNVSTNVTIQNSVNISFYDSETLELINDRNITVQFIGLSIADVKTDIGYIYIENLSYGYVSILYSADEYHQGRYILNINSVIHQNITLYMQNSSTSSLVLITVEDRFGARLQDVEVTIQRWKNGTWQTDQLLVTDFNGQTEGYYVISTAYYNHVLKYEGQVRFGAINDDENKKIIYTEDVSNGISFYIDVLGEDVLSDWQYVDGIITNLTYISYTNTTGYFRFYWITQDNQNVEGCIHVFKHGNLTFNCTSCTTSDTAILTACTVNQTGRGIATYYVIGVIDDYVTDDLIKRIGVNATGAPGTPIDWGSAGYIFGFFIVLIAFFMFLENPTISILAGTFVFCLLSALNVMFPNLSYGIMIGIMAVGVIVALISSKSGVNA